jgi:hypothetical protein
MNMQTHYSKSFGGQNQKKETDSSNLNEIKFNNMEITKFLRPNAKVKISKWISLK